MMWRIYLPYAIIVWLNNQTLNGNGQFDFIAYIQFVNFLI